MRDDDIWQAIVAAVREEIGDSLQAVTPDMTAGDIPGWDSITHVRIVMNAEIACGATLDISKTYRARTIGDLVPILRAAM